MAKDKYTPVLIGGGLILAYFIANKFGVFEPPKPQVPAKAATERRSKPATRKPFTPSPATTSDVKKGAVREMKQELEKRLRLGLQAPSTSLGRPIRSLKTGSYLDNSNRPESMR